MARIRLVGVISVILLVVAAPAHAYPRPGATEFVVQRPDGTQSPIISMSNAVSADGTRIVFESSDRGFLPDDTNPFDAFVRDYKTGTVQQVTVASEGTPATGGWEYPKVFDRQMTVAISAEGRHVAYQTSATGLDPRDTNTTRDVYVHDLATGATEVVSLDAEDAPMAGVAPDISADGRFVTFESGWQLYLRDRQENLTERIDVSNSGTPANFASYGPVISDDGRWVAFQSSASNLGQPDPSEAIIASGAAVYLRDREAGRTERISGPSLTTKSNGPSYSPDISGDGRFVAYWSKATDLIPSDANNADDVFVHDRETGATSRVSVSSDGSEALGRSYAPAISRDGRFVTFTSTAPNLVPGDTNNAADVFVHDRLLGLTERVSVAPDGSESGLGEASAWSSISGSGEVVAFESNAKNFGPVTSGVNTVYRRVRGPAIGFHDIDIAIEGDDVRLAGSALLAGAVVSEGTDDPEPAPLLPLAGSDLATAQILVRHEHGDVAFRLGVAGLAATHVSGAPGRLMCFQGPCPPSAAAHPGVGYRVELDVDGVAHRLSILGPAAVLARCDTACAPVWQGGARVGVTGEEAIAVVPRAALGSPGAAITEIQAVAALGDALTDDAPILDALDLPDGALWSPTIEAGVESADLPEEEVAFEFVGTPSDDAFDILIAGAAAPADHDRRVWTRVCLGRVCGPAVMQAIPAAG